MPNSKIKTLAVDPGYDRIGFAVLEKVEGQDKILYSNCFQPEKTKLIEDRYLSLGQEVKRLVKEYKPSFLAIEKLFFSNNQKTALAVSEAKGLIIYQAVAEGLKVAEYTPGQIKIAVTGYGKATKDQVAFMVGQLTKINMEQKIDDEIDAIAVGLTHLATASHLS